MVVLQPTPVTLSIGMHRHVALLVTGLLVWNPLARAGVAGPELPSASLSSVQSAGQTGATPADPQWIRIAIARNQPQVDLAIQGPFRIIALQTPARLPSDGAGGADPLREGPHLPRVAVRAHPNGIQVGEQLFPSVGVRVEPSQDAAITLNGQRLRGTIDILRQANLTLLVINYVGLEEYLQGVVSKEAPYYWPIEALRAIAIAARTYTLFQRLTKASVDYDVTGDVLSQVYGGKAGERWRTSRAVKSTKGLIMLSDGKVFPAFYHSTCGGLTERGSVMGSFEGVEPLRGGIVCPYCAASPFYRWTQRLTKADVSWAVKQQGRGSLWPVEDLTVVERTPTGRAARVQIRGAQRSLILTGYDFRQLLGFERIRSTAFSIVPQDDAFVIEGRGWGHGVGLCQWGSAELARRGLTAQEILAVYYPRTELVRIGESVVMPIVVEGGH